MTHPSLTPSSTEKVGRELVNCEKLAKIRSRKKEKHEFKIPNKTILMLKKTIFSKFVSRFARSHTSIIYFIFSNLINTTKNEISVLKIQFLQNFSLVSLGHIFQLLFVHSSPKNNTQKVETHPSEPFLAAQLPS